MVYSDYDANFRELLEIANENTILVKAPIPQLSTNCLSVFDHFVGLALKGLNHLIMEINLSRKKKLNLPRPRKKVLLL